MKYNKIQKQGEKNMRLKELRNNKKLNQQQLATLLNVTQTTYGRYELETSEPNIETLCKLADYYNVTLDYLVGRQTKNDIGYLTDKQYSAVLLIKQLSNDNLNRELGRLSTLVEMQ